MRILMLLDRFFPSDIRVEKEGRTLVWAGHEVFLLSIGKDDMPNEEVVQGIRVIRKKLPRKLPKRAWNYFWLQVFFVDPSWKNALKEAVEQYKVEALHIHDLPMVKTGLSIAHKFGIPLIADLHENYPEAIKVYPTSWKGRFIKPLIIQRWKQMEKSSVEQADRVITVVDEAKQHYVSDCGISPEKITVVMNTEDLNHFYSLPIKEDIIKKYQPHFTISYIGGFGWHRGVQTAISGMSEIIEEIPNACLLLVGSGTNESELKELAIKKGLDKAVEFTGWQPFDLVPSYLLASRISLIPHLASGHTNSTIPHKIFQAMAMGKPVIVSSAKPLERIIKETGAGLVYPSENAQALAEAVIRIYQDGALATRLGKAGKRAVKKRYNWEMEGAKLVNVYERLKMEQDTVRTWDRTWSSREKVTFDLNTRVIFKNIAKQISFKGKTVLELGCGSGRLGYLAYQAGAEEVALVDSSEEALRIAGDLFKDITKVTLIRADLLNLDLPKKYDIVFSSGVVEHFKGEELLLAIKAHAKHSKQHMAIVVPSDTIFNNRRSISPKNIKLYGYQKPISPREMERLFKEANISIKQIRRFHSMYGVPLPGIYGIGKLRALLTLALKPLEPFTGGLLVGIGRF